MAIAIGTALAVGGLAKNIFDNRQASVQANKAKRAKRRLNQAQLVRQRRNAVREAQVATADIETKSAAQGGGGSNVSGAISSVGSQLSANLSFLSSTSAISDSATSALSKAAALRSQGSLFQAVGSFAAQNSSRIDNLFSFGGDTAPDISAGLDASIGFQPDQSIA